MSVRAKLSTRSVEGLDQDLVRYLFDVGKRMDAIADLAGGASTADCVTKINAILAALRDAGKMVE